MIQNSMKRTANSPWFQHFITAVILLAGVVVGMETYPSLVQRWGPALHWTNQMIVAIFVVEVVVKMVAEGRSFWRYFYDPWNVFDFIIVVLCLLPMDAGFVAVLRLVRVLRVLKLVTAVPKLQILVGALLKSIPSMFYVSLLLTLLFYLYATTAVFFFSGNDPIHFGSLPLSMLSLFRAVTLEDWTDLMYIQMYGCDAYGYGGSEALCTDPKAQPLFGALFFVSFVLSGTMVILNLFIGVIMNGMEEATAEARELLQGQREERPSLAEELEDLNRELADLQARISTLSIRARRAVQTE